MHPNLCIDETNIPVVDHQQDAKFDGTTLLTVHKRTILLPKPTDDVRDPLNLPKWRKSVILAILILYAVCGLGVIIGLGALIVYISPEYEAAGISEARISGLQTYPPLLLGVGNLISMPLAVSIGRRPVLLASTLLLILSSALCATSKTFEWHLAARILAAFAAAQCEALVLLIISDIFFLHQRGRMLQIFSSMVSTFNSSLVIAASYMANALGWQSWYWLFTALAAVSFILVYIFVPETNYGREISDFMGEPSDTTAACLDNRSEEISNTIGQSRKLKSDLAIFAQKPQWDRFVKTWEHIVQVFFFPHMLWISMMNGLFQAVDVSFQITYGQTLVSPPYNWANTSVSLIQLGQVPLALLCIPCIGMLSDVIIQAIARRNNGVHEPEYRLIPLVIPFVMSLILAVVYGAAIQNPYGYHWFAIVFVVDAWLYILFSASTSGTAYMLDAHPQRAGAILVVIPVVRGLVSFGISKPTVNYINHIGALNLFGVYAAVMGVFALLGIALYFKGKAIRRFCARWAV